MISGTTDSFQKMGEFMSTREQIYIGGAWVPSDGNGSIDVVNPSNEEVIGSIPEGTAADVDAAVAAASGSSR